MTRRDATRRLWKRIGEQYAEIDKLSSDLRWERGKGLNFWKLSDELNGRIRELEAERDEAVFKFRTLAAVSGVDPDAYRPGALR